MQHDTGRHIDVPAGKRRRGAAPTVAQDLEHLVETTAAPPVVEPERLHLIPVPPDADAEEQAAAAQLVNRGGHLRDFQDASLGED